MTKKEIITKLKIRLSNFIIDELKDYGFDTTPAAQWIKDTVDCYAAIISNVREFKNYNDEDFIAFNQIQYDILGEICTTDIPDHINFPNKLDCKKIVQKSYKKNDDFLSHYNRSLLSSIESDYFNYIWENQLNDKINKCCADFIEELII